MEVLRDSIWQFIGAILALIAVILSILFYFVQRRKKLLSYNIISNTPLLTVREELEGNLQVLFQDSPVQNVHLIVVRIINNGNVPITKQDYERHLTLLFGKDATILTVEVTQTVPENLGASVTKDNGKLTLDPLLLNSKDSITIKVLVSDFKEPIKVDARIIGVEDVQQIRERPLRFVMLTLLMLPFLLLAIWVALTEKTTSSLATLLMIIPLIAVFYRIASEYVEVETELRELKPG